jgi:hypothetical protein
MWVCKTDEQIRRSRRFWLSFRGPILWFLLLFVGGIVAISVRPRENGGRGPGTLHEIVMSSMVLAAIAGIVIYVLQLILRRRIDPLEVSGKIVICPKCHRVARPSRDGFCECGGRFDDFDNWEWVIDKKDP